jgi:ankyrin repeat protein
MVADKEDSFNSKLDTARSIFQLMADNEWDKLKRLLSRKDGNVYDVNVRNNANVYPLQLAIAFNRIDIVKLLIKLGARLDVIDEDDRSILYLPIKMRYSVILTELLEASVHAVGISIINLHDKSGKTPVHWAIISGNYDALRILHRFKAAVDLKENQYGHTALHYAAFSNDPNMVKLVLTEMGSKAEAQSVTGETPLHISCNFGNLAITKILLESGANPNIADWENEFTPLMYCVSHDRADMMELLLQYGADINRQDIYGNSSLHYSIYEERWNIFALLVGKGCDLSLVNAEGKNVLHLLAELEKYNLIEKLLFNNNENLDLNSIDNLGRSVLWWIIKDGYWHSWQKQLLTMKLDFNKVFLYDTYQALQQTTNPSGVITDIGSITVLESLKHPPIARDQIDFGKTMISLTGGSPDKTLQDEFMKFLEDGVYNNIKQADFSRVGTKAPEWLITCAKDSSKCRKKIRSEMIERAEFFVENDQIEIYPGDKVRFGTFVGITLDVLFGLHYLRQKWKDVATLSDNPIDNSVLKNYYRQNNIEIRGEFLNFEIVWVYQKLFFPMDYERSLAAFLANPKFRYLLVPLGIETAEGSHANYLMFDKETKIMERFEPHGALAPEKLDYKPTMLDELLEAKFAKHIPGLIFHQPVHYLPRIGFQLLDNFEHNKYRNISDPGGFCALWCIWYIDQRLNYRHYKKKELVAKLIDKARQQKISFRTLVRNFSKNITDLRDKVLAEFDLDINDWLNDNYSETAYEQTIEKIKELWH